MYRFKSIKYLATTGLITALLVAIGYSSSMLFIWVRTFFANQTTLQLFDVLFIAFCAFFKGPMMLFAGSIAGALFDLFSSINLVVIPVTILIRILMFFSIKLLINHHWWSAFYAFFFGALILMLGYPLSYVIIYHDKARVINSLINNFIQASFAYIVSLFLYYYLFKIKFNGFWDDSQFDHLKNKKQKNKYQSLIVFDGEENGIQ